MMVPLCLMGLMLFQVVSSTAWLLPPLQILPKHTHTQLNGLSRQIIDAGKQDTVPKPALINSSESQQLDLSSPRDWLEYWEDQQPGAYTVLRCDWEEGRWTVWGRDFHWKRLQDSYQGLVGGGSPTERLEKESEKVLKVLLEAASAEMEKKEPTTFMLTLLWQADAVVRGHICALGTLLHDLDPDPVTAVVALPRDSNHPPWPNRKDGIPQAKLSSWCRQRRPLEQTLKQPGISEVILVQHEQNVEILEGLISNVFVVSKGGRLQTAPSAVLEGYARQVVLQQAPSCGLTVDDTAPLTIHNVNQWEEVFLTSSIRILTPVNKLLIPIYGPDGKVASLETLWEKEDSSSNPPYWRKLLEQILKEKG